MVSKKLFYTWLIPLMWLAIAILSYFNPGDEYGAFAFSSILGSWILLLVPSPGTLFAIAMITMLTGAICCSGLGFCMDKLKIKPKIFFHTFVVLGLIFLVWAFVDYGSIERMRQKNGSVMAMVAFCFNIGLTVTTIFSLLLAGIWRLVKRKR